MDEQSTYERLKALGYGSAMREEFSLDEEYIQLNHGSVSRCSTHSPRSLSLRFPCTPLGCGRVNGLTQTMGMYSTARSPK